jgi:TPR repeat protein
VKRLLMAVVKRVAAVRAAATPEGFFALGQREYDEGSYASAAQSWGRAVDLKHAHAHALLSMMLIDGRLDVPTDHIRAYELALAGAGMGCAHSKGVLGRCYSAGFGVAANHALSVALGRESAAAGSCMGQSVLAVCCYFGEGGVAQDHCEAVRLWRLAAVQGHAVAQYNLGRMFHEGRGVAQDY